MYVAGNAWFGNSPIVVVRIKAGRTQLWLNETESGGRMGLGDLSVLRRKRERYRLRRRRRRCWQRPCCGWHAVGGFPGVTNSLTGNEDAFVVRLNADLSEDAVETNGGIWAAAERPSSMGIAVDSDGNSYVTGRTESAVVSRLPNAYDDSFDVFGTGAPFTTPSWPKSATSPRNH